MAVRSMARSVRGGRGGTRSVTAALIIGACVLGAAILLTHQERPTVSMPPPVVAAFDAVQLPVPVEPVAAGTRLKEVRFRSVAFPKHQVPVGAITNMAGFQEAVTVAALPANLPLFEANLSFQVMGSNPVLERIPSGMRAMTIRVDATSAVEGWAGSGSVVDVLLIERDRTTVVAEQVKILSAERSVSPVEGQSAPSVPSTVTILVSQEQCLAINTAVPRGRIAFALRGATDQESWSETSFTSERLHGNALGEESAEGAVTGYVAIRDEKTSSFALTDGKWVRTEVIPEGFLVARKKD